MRGDATFLRHAGRTLHKLHNAAVAIALPRGYRTTRRMSYISLQSMLCVRVRVSCVCDGIGGCPTSPAKLKERRHAIYQHTAHTKYSGLRRSCRMCITALRTIHTICACCATLLRWLLRRRLYSTARMSRSIEFRQEAMGPCGLSSQLPRRLDFFAEK